MAGGQGTRLMTLTGGKLPKPMIPIDGKPIIQHQIETLKANGVIDMTIVTGYLGENIRSFFGDGRAFGVNISYFHEETPLGTAGALRYLRQELKETFFVAFGDIIFDIDLMRFYRYHREKGGVATILAHPNAHPYDSDIVIADADGRVSGFLPKRLPRDFWYGNLVNAGLYFFEPGILDLIAPPARHENAAISDAAVHAGSRIAGTNSFSAAASSIAGSKRKAEDAGAVLRIDLEKDILAGIVAQPERGAIFAYSTPEYVKDAGTPERLAEVEQAIRNGVVAQRNLHCRQRAVFLDRDGTINREAGLIARESQFVLEDQAADAIRLLNDSGFLALVETNQPAVARGLCSISDIENIHKKMATLLGERGAYLDDVMYCPHHPDRGFPEENPAYKIDCMCRKPKTGMIDAFAKQYNIDLTASWMVGDRTVDIQTGLNAGLKTILLRTGEAGRDGKYPATPDMICDNILEAAKFITRRRS